MSNLESVRHALIQNDDIYRSLHQEHQVYKERLQSIRVKSLLSEEDEIEMKKIKLHKLSLKDRMESILQQHIQTGATA